MGRIGTAETVFAGSLLAICLVLSLALDLPFVAPSLGSAAFVGVHYLMPLVGVVAIVGCCGARGGDQLRLLTVAAPCYALVLWLHFNLKLWVPFINPASYDAVFARTDDFLRPIVDASLAIRRLLGAWVPGVDGVYMNGFVVLFYCSFVMHAMRTPTRFRAVVLAALFLQGLGGLSYLLFPAIGPFAVEPGVNPVATGAQAQMLAIRREVIEGGRPWLEAHGSEAFVAALAAMPSLHAGGSALFCWFAWKDCRVLLPIYLPLFGFILMGAIANRFHYVIDLPVGVALAALSIWLAERVVAYERRGDPARGAALQPCASSGPA